MGVVADTVLLLGTKAGDPTEANWVGERFARSSELLIGSVKGNIGYYSFTQFRIH